MSVCTHCRGLTQGCVCVCGGGAHTHTHTYTAMCIGCYVTVFAGEEEAETESIYTTAQTQAQIIIRVLPLFGINHSF